MSGSDQEPRDSDRGEEKTDKDSTKQRSSSVSRANKNDAKTKNPNLVVKLLEKHPLGMTLPEMAGGTRKLKRIKVLRPMLTEAIKEGLVMPISQRAGHTVYKLVKHMGSR